MDDVGAACGVTKLIVYRHFGSKEELYREILQQVFDHLGVELRAELAMPTHAGLGPRTLLTVAREDPAAFTLLWRHAAREPQFADYAAELRSISASVVRQLSELDTGDEMLDAWHSEALFGWLVEATLTWLERGDPARDDAFVEQTVGGLPGAAHRPDPGHRPRLTSPPVLCNGVRIWVPGRATPGEGVEVATFVLVHGAMHGGWCWRDVRRRLAQRGHDVFCPTLAGQGDRRSGLTADVGVDTHIADLEELLWFEDLSEVHLVLHSYAGILAGPLAGARRSADGVRCVPRCLRDGTGPEPPRRRAAVGGGALSAPGGRRRRWAGSCRLPTRSWSSGALRTQPSGRGSVRG